jgi:hypothetical protein
MPEQGSWFYRTFICGHWLSGQILSTRKRSLFRGKFRKPRHYRFCQKCGKKFYVD